MWQLLLLIFSSLLVAACGGGIDSFEDGVDAQADVMREMVSVLEGVDDESSAEKAAERIEALGNELADISSQMGDLPRPNAEEMQEIGKKQRIAMQGMEQNAMAQMMKLAQYPVLFEAWMRAMQNMQ
jgi:hypothetical protein